MDIEKTLKDKFVEFTNNIVQMIPDNILSLITDGFLSLFMALLIFFVGKWFTSKIVKIFVKVLKKASLEDTLVKFLENILYYTLIVVVALAALNKLGVETTSFIAILGAAGLAIGLALKDSLNNFASGVMIVFFKPFKVGDSVVANGVSGTITEVRIFDTVFLTADNQKIIVPNGSIIKGSITNVNANPTRRIDINLAISYEASVKEVKEVLEKILSNNKRILEDKPYSITVSDLSEGSMKILLCAWVNSSEFGSVKAELLEDIKNNLDEAGIALACTKKEFN